MLRDAEARACFEKDAGSFNGIAQIKRFLERYTADPAFQEEVRGDPERAVEARNIAVDPREIRAVWDEEDETPEDEAPEPVKRYRAFFRHQLDWRDEVIRASAPSDPRFKTWRARQIARCRVQMYLGNEKSVVHAPLAFELSKGCSVGCWFCGVGAGKLTAHFECTEENRRLWTGMLRAAREVIGPAAAQGFCYWASDPLDNPDYERFCTDFADELGLFPQTTTAIAMRDPARTRELLELSSLRGCDVNRFSLLSLELMDRVHREFTAEELLWVELIAQNRESSVVKANSGRFRERVLRKPEILENEKRKLQKILDRLDVALDEEAERRLTRPATSIACVSGFLVNLVERSVKLISPCPASDRWPLGYYVFGEGRFETAGDFRALLEDLVATHMTTAVRPQSPLRFHSELEYQELDFGFRLSGEYKDVDYSSPDQSEFLKRLGRAIRGGKTPEEIALSLFYQHGIHEPVTRRILNGILAMGVLDEEPGAWTSPR